MATPEAETNDPTPPTVLAGTWSDGLFAVTGEVVQHELAGQPVRGLVSDGRGGALALVDGHGLSRRTADGRWTTVAAHGSVLSCAVPVGDEVFVGTDDARMLRIGLQGRVDELSGFDRVPGRDSWYAGTAVINGVVMGPPLGVRSITATAEDGVLLAGVHVGGIPRSTDGGRSWQPTLEVDHDVHDVCAHPTRPELVIAACAVGLCVSNDGGATWTVETDGLHASYCSAVTFSGDELFVAASTDHFSAQGAVYRRAVDEPGSLRPAEVGRPSFLAGIADTNCLATRESTVAIVDKSGHLYVSLDDGGSWSCGTHELPGTSCVLIV